MSEPTEQPQSSSSQAHQQRQPLLPPSRSSTTITPANANYGALPTSSSGVGLQTSNTMGRRSSRARNRVQLSPTSLGFPRTATRTSQHDSQHEHSPLSMRRPMSMAGLKESLREGWSTLKRTPSTYDPPLDDVREGDKDDTEAARINGIRVWYSSFTSVDWLHDAVSAKPSILYR
jgi:hypothetical protein